MPSHISLGMCRQMANKTWHMPYMQMQRLIPLRIKFSCTERIIVFIVNNPFFM